MMDNQNQQQTSPPQQPPIPPQNVNPVPAPQQSSYGKRGWLKWALILILVATLSSGATYFVLNSQSQKPPPPQIVQTIPSPTPDLYTEGTRSATTNWKTYRTPYFLIRYPQDWNPEDIKNSEFKIDTTVVAAIRLSKIVLKNNVSLRMDVFVRRYTDNPGFSVQSFENKKDITIDGVPAVRSTGEASGGEATGFGTVAYVKRDNVEYFIQGANYYYDNFDEFDQILSTFKFTSP